MVPRNAGWLSLPLFVVWIAACSLVAPHFEKPILSVAGIELVGGNLLQQNLMVTFNVENPNDRALPVTGLHAELSVLDERIASGSVDRPFVVPAHGSTRFDMPIRANLALVLLKLSSRADKNADVPYELIGAVNIDLPFLHEVPFRQHGEFSLKSPQ
ncbi:MAG TPA: LEA type 2 family protein [Steroidobacteraceae bacterium]|nr:LEA type 2 family protein [Steroidobacteraceae bacterium]